MFQALDILLIMALAYLLAYVFSMLFESPFINLDKLFLTPHSIKGNKKNQSERRREGGTQYQSAATSSNGSIQDGVNPQHHFKPIESAPDEHNVTVYAPPASNTRHHNAGASFSNETEDLPPKYQEHA